MGNNIFTKLAKRYPFISLVIHANAEYIGIIQNRDDVITTIYDFGSITNVEHKKSYLELAEIWWEESNRSIPINIFLKNEWNQFRYTLKTFSNKELEILHGPACSMSEIYKKKVKRKSITLVRKID